MKRLFASIIPLFMGCAANSPPSPEPVAEMPEPPQCPAGEFRGVGIGRTEGEALSIAHAELAKQINSSVKVTTEHSVSQKMLNGNESLGSAYKSRAVIESSLANAHDARVAHKKQSGGRIGVTVCMSKADAAKGFLERQRIAADSLEMLSGTSLNEKRPKLKNDAWGKTQTLWNQFMGIQNLLEGWKIESKYLEQASVSYAKARDDYKDYCKNMKVHWEDSGNECSDATFAAFSKKAKMEKSKCAGGLRLRFACTEKCKSASYGMECSFEPSLAIESCEGERYSLLRAKEPVTGFDMHSASRAKENLIENLPKAAFFSEWEKEVKEWVPQCAE